MGRNSLPTRAIIVDGDVSRRIASVYVPDFYKENPIFKTSIDLLKNSAYELEYVFGMIQKMPELVDVHKCPDHLLPLLGSLLGYKWKPELSVYSQRREISKLVQVYLIKGSPRSVIRLVYYAGASISDVMTPSDHLFQLDKSKLSGGDHFEDPEFWRWGTYEVVADIDFSKLNEGINAIHPAGELWYGRQLIQLLSVNSGKENGDGYGGMTEVEVIHTGTSNYFRRNAELYRDLVLNGCDYNLYEQEYLLLSYKSDSLYGSNGDNINSWSDYPNQLYTAYQEDEINQPSYVAPEYGRNNLQVVDFDGTDYLTIPSLSLTDIVDSLYETAHAVFIVVKLNALTSSFIVGNSTNVIPGISYIGGSLYYRAKSESDESPEFAEFTWAGDTDWHVISFVRYDSTVSCYMDGEELTQVTSNVENGKFLVNTIGGSNNSTPFTGRLAEFAVISGSNLSQGQLNDEWEKANNYLMGKWGWTVSEPSISPIVYYRLDEPDDLEITKAGFTSDYGSAIYGESEYGASEVLGRIAYNNTSSKYHAHYNLESELLFKTNSTDNTYDPDIPLSVIPINPGTVLVEVGDIILNDNGKGHLTGNDGKSSAKINYDTGVLSDFRFPYPPGSWTSSDIPLLRTLEDEISTTDQALWIKSDTDIIYDLEYGQVTSWADQTENEYVFSSNVTDRQPLFVESSVNGLPSIEFNGTSCMPINSTLDLGTEHTIFIVFKPTIQYSNRSILVSGAGGESLINIGVNSTVGFSSVSYRSNSSICAVNYTPKLGAWHLLTIVRDNANPKFYINGHELTEKWDTTYTSDGSFILDTIGALDEDGTDGFTGHICEIAAYTSALDQSTRRSIELAMSKKYLIPSGQVLWYDANDLSDSKFLWVDKSSQGNTAVQGELANIPSVRPFDTPIGMFKLAYLSGTLADSANAREANDYFWLRAGEFLKTAAIYQDGSTKKYIYTFSTFDNVDSEFTTACDGESGEVETSDLILRKNGVIYGTPHSSESTIKTVGVGAYRHVGSELWFSLPSGETESDSKYSVERPLPSLGTNHTISFVFSLKRLNNFGLSTKMHSFLSSFGEEAGWIYYNPTVGDEKFIYQVDESNSWEVDVSGSALEINKLYCLTIVRKDNRAEFYLNNERISNNALPSIVTNTEVTFSRFGVEPNDGENDHRLHPFNGYLAELIIYDRSLSIDEREELDSYTQTKWGIIQTPVMVYYNDYVKRGVSSVLPSTSPERTGVLLGGRPRINKGCIRLEVQGDNVALQPFDNSYGVEAWVKTSFAGCIFSMEWSQDTYPCKLHVNITRGGRIRFIAEYGASTKVKRTSPVIINDKEWHHIFVGIDRTSNLIKIFIDGALTLIGDTDFGDTEFLPNTELILGASLAYTEEAELRNFLRGGLDEIAIYKGALPDDDCILRHYLYGNNNLAVVKSTVKYIVSTTEIAGGVSQPSFIVGRSKMGSDDVLGEARLAAMCTEGTSQNPWTVTTVSP